MQKTRLNTELLTEKALPSRTSMDHKGLFGHVLVIGGDRGMGGSVCLAAEAALRTGAGLVSAITRPEHVSALLTRCPEVMCYGLSDNQDFDTVLLSLFKKATVCVIGPGMSDSSWSNVLLDWFLAHTSIPMIIDAGAFDWLIKKSVVNIRAQDNWVLTPHPGEAARLLNISTDEIQQDRIVSIQALQKKWGGIIVLKGAGTLIYDAASASIQMSSYQNAAMATAGMGDVLSGIMGALIAQGCSPFHAASQGVWLHAHAAELAFQEASKKCPRRVLLASELFSYLS